MLRRIRNFGPVDWQGLDPLLCLGHVTDHGYRASVQP